MKITCISDLHGYYPELPGGDLLIVAGDLTKRDDAWEYIEFGQWLNSCKYRKKIVIGGNHDNIAQRAPPFIDPGTDEWSYLFDSAYEFEGLKIWGSPWTSKFPGINPKCCAFTCDTDEELAEKWKIIPNDIDILVTHGPAWGIGDKTWRGENVGSRSLGLKAADMNPPKLWVWGHIHEAYGEQVTRSGCRLINASHVNEYYEPVNAPINIEL